MASIFEEPHRITYYETDTKGDVTPSMLIDMAILVSEDQNDSLKMPRSETEKLNVAWVVVQYSIDIFRLPKINEMITLATQATAHNKLFALREFWIRDANGAVCAHILSTWITMDMTKRELTMMPSQIVDPYESEVVKVLPHLPRPKRIKDADGSVQQRAYRVRYSDIDFNHHVNNAKYLDWIIDAMPYDFLTQHQPNHIDIKFENEVLYGNQITSLAQSLENGSLTKHEIHDGQKTSAVANIRWQRTNN